MTCAPFQLLLQLFMLVVNNLPCLTSGKLIRSIVQVLSLNYIFLSISELIEPNGKIILPHMSTNSE